MKKNISFEVKGMHCASCETLIKEELSDVPGVTDVQVDHKTGAGSLVLETLTTSPDDVKEAISKSGYQANIAEIKKTNGLSKKNDQQVKIIDYTVAADNPIHILLDLKIQHNMLQDVKINSPQQTVKLATVAEKGAANKRAQFALYGMHCSSCAAIIERAINKVEGIKEAHVNFAAEKASVVYDEARVTSNKIVEAIQKAGYRASSVDQNDAGFEVRKRTEEIKSQFARFVISLVLSAPMLYFMLFDFFIWIPFRALLLPYI